MSQPLEKLRQRVDELQHHAEQFDNAKWFDKNRYIQSQPSLFDSHVFRSKSLKLGDYVDEVKEALANLPPQSQRHALQYAVEHIGEQIEAIIKVLKSTPVWAKENRFQPHKKAKVYRQAVKKIMQPSHELYQELSQNHEFERRLQEMISLRQDQLIKASPDQASQLNKEILALHGRLGRCRKAISATEDKIQLQEKQNRS
ncbi:primosomal replication protein N'' [Pseudoalteromonas rubra]|uniref:Primosomal replication protein N n=1 Tax=Pseudoalteromonas rubra TaxID=43658 RepID=A0A8T0C7K6_9GAMM|nr:primosomal replication protein [Pseudoalteromonas rubra]KAF7786737.1 primosomal replication protein N'' [Pseudoalteromonas rubra]